jgi:DNA-binding NarL/FixJ family response regulator
MDEHALLIVSDDRLTRAGLSAVLVDVSGLKVVGESDTRPDAADLLDLYQPAVILWDLGWDLASSPGHTPSPLERLAAVTDLNVPVVALLTDERYASAVWHTGIAGLLPRTVGIRPLAAALIAAAAHLRVLDPQLAADVVAPQGGESFALAEPLTPREEEVLALLAEGLTNRAIGHSLHISEHTAKFHVQALMGKLGAQSRTEAVVRATRLGLLIL